MVILESTKTKLNNEIKLIGNEIVEKGNCTIIIGVVHGDEPQGEFLINNFIKKNNIPKNLLFVPSLNPDGLELETITNDNEVDINRNFPTENWKFCQPIPGDLPSISVKFSGAIVEGYCY